jgi:ribosomal protein S18 acetylase RimI-like enzyme
MGIVAQQVAAAAELEAIYRLRYAVYIEELGNRHPLADAERRRLRDAMDDAAPIVVGAYTDSELIGTVRFNAIAACARDALTFHQIPDGYFADGDRRFVASMLIVARRFRSSPVVVHLCREATRLLAEAGALSLHLYGESHNIELYERMGASASWDRPLQHPIYRQVFPARFDANAEPRRGFYKRMLRARNSCSASASAAN